MVHVLGQRVEAEVLGDAVHAPGLGHGLEGADQQLAGVLLVVGALVGDPQHRQVARQLGHRLGDDVEVLGRVQRHDDADRGRQLARPHAGGEHDGVGARSGPRSVITPTALPCSTRMRSTFTSSTIRAPRWRAPLAKAWVVSIGLACPSLGRNTPPTTSPTSSSGIARLDLGRPDHLDREAEALGHRGAALQLLEALVVERQR